MVLARIEKNLQHAKASDITRRKKVLVLHTGGTFGGPPESTEKLDLDAQLRQKAPEIFDLAHLSLEVLFQEDSSNLGPTEWRQIAENIHSAWNAHDAFVVIHGTDTLAYCASFLALTFANVGKPIIITGSQRPLAEIRSDARMNIIDSIQLATLGLAEVMVCFNSDVFLGSRASKVSNLDLGAFHSPNFPKLGHFGVEILLNTSYFNSLPQICSQKESEKRPPDLRAQAQITCLGVVPGLKLDPAFRKAVIDSSKGIILEGFGLGHAPIQASKGAGWLELVSEAADHMIPVIMTSQCRSGRVDMNLYEVGREFSHLGVIPALDMTRECATVKLMLLLGRQIPFSERMTFMKTPLWREISSPDQSQAPEKTRH